jgi:Flp pilus assembly protein TadG
VVKRRPRRSGNSNVEFVLVAIPLIFLLISGFEISRGMWIYHTLEHAVAAGARYVIVHGADCSAAPNSCQVTVQDVATTIEQAAVGLDPSVLNVTLQAGGGAAIPCVPLNACLSNATVWPSGAGAATTSDIVITAHFDFRSAISLVWPGSQGVSPFGPFNIGASVQEQIQY